jgi:rubrerythrin
MSQFKESKTALYLMRAFAGESQARNRYTYYASVAKKQGFIQIANIFLETAENEKEHAKLFYKKLIEKGLEGENISLIDTAYPIVLSEDTLKNLEYSQSGELEEWSDVYPRFAKEAEDEGHKDVAVLFRMIAVAETAHEKRYAKLIKNVRENTAFKKDGKVFWKCINCGYVFENIEAPAKCPACLHPKDYFQIQENNY